MTPSSNHIEKKAIFIMGPTASGKTALAMELAKKYSIEIISVDSSMIYKGMDIGTGKPTREELNLAPHKLIDILEPNQSYSVADFCDHAVAQMEKALDSNKIPVLVGGTMMYFNALKNGLSKLPSADPKLREDLLEEAESCGWQHMHERLKELDPIAANRINPNDPQRIQRALEVNLITSKPMHESFEFTENKLKDWNIKQIAIMPVVREDLHKNIAVRFNKMLDMGFIKEVKNLVEKYHLNLDYPSLRSVGYRQIYNYLNNEYNFDTMVEKSLAATRQLAKRQYTWLRPWKDMEIFDIVSDDVTNQIIAILESQGIFSRA